MLRMVNFGLLRPGPAGAQNQPLLRELPAHDAQQSFDRGIVEVRLQLRVNRCPMLRTHLLVDDTRHREVCDARQELTIHRTRRLPGALRSAIVERLAQRLTRDPSASQRPIVRSKARGPIRRAKKYKRIISQISGTYCGIAGKSVTSREYRDESLSQNRFNQEPISLFAVAKEAQSLAFHPAEKAFAQR